MKLRMLFLLVPVFAMGCAYADNYQASDNDDSTDAVAPDISAYMAKEKPVPLRQRLRGPYVSVKGAGAFKNVKNIQDASEYSNPNAQPFKVKNTTASGFTPGIETAIGFSWASRGVPVRLELAYAIYKSLDYDEAPLYSNDANNRSIDSLIRTQTVMLNAYYDIHINDKIPFSPYIGAGIGGAWNTVESNSAYQTGLNALSDKTTTKDLAWAVGAGVRYEVTSSLFLDLAYKYMGLGTANWGNLAGSNQNNDGSITIKSDSIHAHILSAGLTFQL